MAAVWNPHTARRALNFSQVLGSGPPTVGRNPWRRRFRRAPVRIRQDPPTSVFPEPARQPFDAANGLTRARTQQHHLQREVGEFQELPFWLVDPDWAGFMNVDVSKAVRAGLAFRPIEETVRDTLAWARDHRGWKPSKQSVQLAAAGMAPKREAELLAEWKARA